MANREEQIREVEDLIEKVAVQIEKSSKNLNGLLIITQIYLALLKQRILFEEQKDYVMSEEARIGMHGAVELMKTEVASSTKN